MNTLNDQNIQQHLLEVARSESELSIGELVDRVSKDSGTPSYLITRNLYQLRLDGKVIMDDPHPADGVGRYVKSHYGLWFWAVVTFILMTGISIYLLPQDPPFLYLRYMLGSVFILYLPGFTLIEALYPKKGDLDGLERLALSIGLSLALVPLIGLVLNYTPWGIRLDPIVISLSFVTLVLAFAATLRKVGYIKLSYTASKH